LISFAAGTPDSALAAHAAVVDVDTVEPAHGRFDEVTVEKQRCAVTFTMDYAHTTTPGPVV
jgi:hypothetical protein